MSYKKSLQSPTISSSQKIIPQPNLRERLGRLTDAVNELRMNVEHEAYQQESLEKLSTKNYTILNTQIKALRKAFNALADVVIEELDAVKTDVYKEFQETATYQNKRIDDMTNAMYKVQNSNEEQKNQNIALEQDVRDRIHALEQKQEEQNEYVHEYIKTTQEENKILFEKLKNLITNNTNQIQIFSNDLEKYSSQATEIKAKLGNNTNAIMDINKKIIDIDENYKITYQELANKIQDLKTNQVLIKENMKNEIQNILKNHHDLIKNVDEVNIKFNNKLETIEQANNQKFYDFEHLLTQMQNEFQENIQDLARIHKDSSNQIILDFEKAITCCNNEAKILFKKINLIENSLSKHKEEFNLMLTDQEHIVSRKNEQFNKAIFDICRQLNITNPLISYQQQQQNFDGIV